MHILLIHQYFQETDDPGGLRWNEMARLWAKEGHKITVIAGMTHYTKGIRNPKYNRKYIYEDKFAENITVIRTHVSDSYNNNFKGRFRAYFSFVFSGIYGGLFKAKKKYDIIIVSSPPLSVGIIALILSFFKRIPFVLEIRDLWPESAIDTGILKNKLLIRLSFMLERIMYKKAKLINVLTPAMKNYLITHKNIESNKIIYIPNAADFEISDKLATSFNRDLFRAKYNLENDLILCYVGAHGVANHLIQLIEAAELLKNEPIQFILIGDGMQKKMLMEECKEKKLLNVHFFDSVTKEEALQFIFASDAGISVLKKADAFKTVYSNKTFDYMSCRKPVLMAIDGISKILIEDANAGVYINPEDAADFAAKVKMYVQNPSLLKTQGENGYQYAKKYFDRIPLAFSYLSYLNILINNEPLINSVDPVKPNASNVS